MTKTDGIQEGQVQDDVLQVTDGVTGAPIGITVVTGQSIEAGGIFLFPFTVTIALSTTQYFVQTTGTLGVALSFAVPILTSTDVHSTPVSQYFVPGTTGGSLTTPTLYAVPQQLAYIESVAAYSAAKFADGSTQPVVLKVGTQFTVPPTTPGL